MTDGRPLRVWRLVLVTELLGILRDRRALFAGLVLPALLYPLMFLGQGWLEDIAEETLEAKEVHIAVELAQLDEELRERVLQLLEQQVPIVIDELPPGACDAIDAALQEGTPEAWMRESELAQDILGTDGDLLLHALPDPSAPENALFRMHFDGANDDSREARSRTNEALDTLREEQRTARFASDFGGDPAAGFVSRSLDLASDEDKGGALLGRLLPLIAVLVLLSGGSFAALAAFAGERESGTLETLLVQPVEGLKIVQGKFLAVLTASFATLVLNTASLLGCVALGLGKLPAEGAAGGLGIDRILLGALLLVPVSLLVASVLCLVCGKARSFREGQNYILPLTLVAALPSALALSPEVELDPLLACVPIAGSALALREAMIGNLAWLPGLLAFSTTLGYAWLALRKLGTLFDGERALSDSRAPEELAQRRGQSRAALAWGWGGVFAVYLVGGLVQSLHPLWGLAATLWLLLPFAAWRAARGTARRAGESLRETLALRLPAPHHALAAVLLAPPLVRLAETWIVWQQTVLPLPSGMTDGGGLAEEILSLSPASLVFALAVSPGICEELFFRGAILSGLRRDLPAWRVVLWQAVLFGAVHASIYRFAPTAVLGALLAALTLRTRSLLPAVLLHIAYNGSLVLGHDALPFLSSPWTPYLAVPALLLLALPGRGTP